MCENFLWLVHLATWQKLNARTFFTQKKPTRKFPDLWYEVLGKGTHVVLLSLLLCLVLFFYSFRENAVCIGQALVDTKRLKIVSSIDEEFRDESNLFLELGEMASLQPSSSSPMVTDAPKWFQHLPEDGDSEYEVSGRSDTSSMQGVR